jgi:hypothetical protein
MIILTEGKKIPVIKPVYLTENQYKAIKQAGLLEANNLPALAKMAGISSNPKITSVVRQDTIYNTCVAMGLPTKINKMNNVVVEVMDSPTAAAVLSTIYQQFGVKGSFMMVWTGKGKIYFDPSTPVDQAPMLAYSKATGLPPINPRKYLA